MPLLKLTSYGNLLTLFTIEIYIADLPDPGELFEPLLVRAGNPGPRSRDISHIGSIVVDTLLEEKQ